VKRRRDNRPVDRASDAVAAARKAALDAELDERVAADDLKDPGAQVGASDAGVQPSTAGQEPPLA
jgi:hypothetical protein